MSLRGYGYRFMAILPRFRANAFKQAEYMGWAEFGPAVIMRQGDTYWAFDEEGKPLAHPHVSTNGYICFGDMEPSTRNAISILMNINLDSVYWHPTLTGGEDDE